MSSLCTDDVFHKKKHEMIFLGYRLSNFTVIHSWTNDMKPPPPKEICVFIQIQINLRAQWKSPSEKHMSCFFTRYQGQGHSRHIGMCTIWSITRTPSASVDTTCTLWGSVLLWWSASRVSMLTSVPYSPGQLFYPRWSSAVCTCTVYDYTNMYHRFGLSFQLIYKR